MNRAKLILEGLNPRVAFEAQIEDVMRIFELVGHRMTDSSVTEESNPHQRVWRIRGTIQVINTIEDALGISPTKFRNFDSDQKQKFMDYVEDETGVEMDRMDLFAVPRKVGETNEIRIILRR
jgi:hypothetical protein